MELHYSNIRGEEPCPVRGGKVRLVRYERRKCDMFPRKRKRYVIPPAGIVSPGDTRAARN